MNRREPVFNAPGVVLALIAVFVALHVIRQYLSIENATWMLLSLAFIPARYSGLAADIPGGELAKWTSFVTHMFVHADWVHVTVNSAWLLAFGSVLSRRMGALRFLAFALGGGIAGALAFLAMNPGLAAPVIGASGAVAAMMGGVMRFLFNAIDRREGYLLAKNPSAIPLMSLKTTLTDPRIIMASAVFIGMNLLTIVGFGGLGTAAGAIAWEAHLGGFFFGLFAFALFDAATQKTSPYGREVD